MRILRNILIGGGVTLLLLFGIGAWLDSQQPPQVDDGLVKYVETWKRDCQDNGVELGESWLRLSFIEYREPQAGTAGQSWKKERTVVIRPGYGEYQTLALVYHELGHAVFDLKHEEGTLMDCELQSEQFYKQNWDELTTHYFEKVKGL